MGKTILNDASAIAAREIHSCNGTVLNDATAAPCGFALTSLPLMERLFSSYGVNAHGDHDNDGNADAGVIDDVILRASEEIMAVLQPIYKVDDLVKSAMVRGWATTLAVYYLCERRGNPIPDSIAVDYDRITADGGFLDRVQRKRFHIPCVSKRPTSIPVFSNLEVDRRYWREKVRVTARNSSPVSSRIEQDRAPDLGIGSELEG